MFTLVNGWSEDNFAGQGRCGRHLLAAGWHSPGTFLWDGHISSLRCRDRLTGDLWYLQYATKHRNKINRMDVELLGFIITSTCSL